jgi:hypothetical protein
VLHTADACSSFCWPHLQTCPTLRGAEPQCTAGVHQGHHCTNDGRPPRCFKVGELAEQQLTAAKCQSHPPYIIIAVGKARTAAYIAHQYPACTRGEVVPGKTIVFHLDCCKNQSHQAARSQQSCHNNQQIAPAARSRVAIHRQLTAGRCLQLQHSEHVMGHLLLLRRLGSCCFAGQHSRAQWLQLLSAEGCLSG